MFTWLYRSAAIWTVIGLMGGLYYREFTKAHDWTGGGQLGLVHTHALVLGTLAFLLVLILAKTFALDSRRMAFFVIVWNIGLALTVGTQIAKGTLQVLGREFATSPAIAGVAGLGHMTLTAGFILLFMALGKALKTVTP